MLVLTRPLGSYTDIIHRASGDVIRVYLADVDGRPSRRDGKGRARLGFEDRPYHFDVQRPERRLTSVKHESPDLITVADGGGLHVMRLARPTGPTPVMQGIAGDDLPDPGDCAVS